MALRVGAHVAEAAAENSRQLAGRATRPAAGSRLLLVDQVAAGLGVLAMGEAFVDGPDASADAIARVDDDDVGAHRHQVVRGGETGEACAGDED